MDYHARARAILVTARSQRIGESLQIPDPVQSARCTICHSPAETLPASAFEKGIKPDFAVSCETCHGPAEGWLRSHTRKDFSHADRVGDGMRDLRNLYVRAGVCVACHQNLDPEVLAAGHPELIFEFDGQTQAEPPHWREHVDRSGAQTWLIGQAVALREMSWQMQRQPDPQSEKRLSALIWLLGKVAEQTPGLPKISAPVELDYSSVTKRADELARHAAAIPWNQQMADNCIHLLAGSGDEFTSPQPDEIRRAELLALALDRVLPATTLEEDRRTHAAGAVRSLFSEVDSTDAFDRIRFADSLRELSTILNRGP